MSLQTDREGPTGSCGSSRANIEASPQANSTKTLENYQNAAKSVQLSGQVPNINGGGFGGNPSDTGSAPGGTPPQGAGAMALAPPTFMVAVAAAFMLL